MTEKGKARRPGASDETRTAEARRRRFANALARAEFGRHYWDDRLEDELRSVLRKKKRK